MNTVGCAASVGRQSGAKIHPQGKWFYPLSERWHLVRHPTSLLEVGPSCHITRRKEGAREGGGEGGTDNVCRIRACKCEEEGSLSDVYRPPSPSAPSDNVPSLSSLARAELAFIG